MLVQIGASSTRAGRALTSLLVVLNSVTLSFWSRFTSLHTHMHTAGALQQDHPKGRHNPQLEDYNEAPTSGLYSKLGGDVVGMAIESREKIVGKERTILSSPHLNKMRRGGGVHGLGQSFSNITTQYGKNYLSNDGALGNYMVSHGPSRGCMVPPGASNQQHPMFLVLHDVIKSDQSTTPGIQLQDRFPSTFDPRNAPNMSHKEKVDKWISDVPIYPVARPRELHVRVRSSSQMWHSECYPGTVPSSSSASDGNHEEVQYELEDQYWGINTRFNNQHGNGTVYGTDAASGFRVGLFVEQEDVLEYQSRKITRYVKKMYQQDLSEKVVRGGNHTMVSSPKSKNTSYNRDANPKSAAATALGQDAGDVPVSNGFSIRLSEALDDDLFYDMCLGRGGSGCAAAAVPPPLPERKKRVHK